MNPGFKHYCELQIQVDTKYSCVKNTHSVISVQIHSNHQKKCKLTKEQMKRPTCLKMEQVSNGLYPFFDILTMHHDKLYNKTNEMHFLEFYSAYILLYVLNRQAIHLQEALLLYIRVHFMVCIMRSKHVEDVSRIKFKKVHLIGFIMQYSLYPVAACDIKMCINILSHFSLFSVYP